MKRAATAVGDSLADRLDSMWWQDSKVGDLVLTGHIPRMRGRYVGVLESTTRRRVAKDAPEPVTYYHIRGVDGVCRRFTNTTLRVLLVREHVDAIVSARGGW